MWGYGSGRSPVQNQPSLPLAPSSSLRELSQLHLGFLDFAEMLAQFAKRAESERGREACLGMVLSRTRAEAENRLMDVAEAVDLFDRGDQPPSLSFTEIEAHLDAAQRGAALGAEELRQVAQFCEVVDGIRRWFGRHVSATPVSRAPRLSAKAQGLGRYEALVTRARETFDPAGEIRDSASPDLMRLRRERDQLASRARDEAERLLRSEEFSPYLQDEYVTLREDRFVLPLKASFKSMGLGIVHDTSRSGETVFLEPTRLVEGNNRLKVIQIEIRRECRRILEELARAVADAADGLRADRDVLVALDVVMAGARLSRAYGGVAPQLTDEAVVDLVGVRHPLLALRAAELGRGAVVANDVWLGAVPGRSAARLLVLSGPNAGGKTVLLKAVGLAALLARAGLFVPASVARVGFFDAVLADIGDQQSVTGDLSTFSAHLGNVAGILEVAATAGEAQVLVLVDELMSGTHPEQGAALARATLETLAATKALVIATTHFDSLKALTEGDDRFRNGGMEYDLQNLRPTFRLRDGLPGRSYALDIASRMGLPESVLNRARELAGQGALGLEEVLRSLEEREAALERSVAALDEARAELVRQTDAQKDAAASLQRKEKELGQKSRDAVDAAVQKARVAIEQIVREVQTTRTRAAAEAGRRALEQQAREATAGLPERKPLDLEALKEALTNRGLGGRGGDPRRAPAQAVPHEDEVARARAQAADQIPFALQTRTNALDLRGHRADEAIDRVMEFLDQAVLRGEEVLFVIHGHGTGTLRKVVREYLATSPYVARFRPGATGEGGDGVSVVTVRG